MSLQMVDTPNRGKAPIEISDETVAEYVQFLPDLPATGKGLRDESVTFKSQSSATNYGNKLIKAIVKVTGDEYLSANVNDEGHRLVKLGLTTRQINGQWTTAVRHWDR